MYEPAKVAKFEDASLWVEKKVLGFDVSVTDSVGMDVGQRAEQLVHVHLRRRERERERRGEREREKESCKMNFTIHGGEERKLKKNHSHNP